ncbi:protein FAM228A [Festucalex cinctus]
MIAVRLQRVQDLIGRDGDTCRTPEVPNGAALIQDDELVKTLAQSTARLIHFPFRLLKLRMNKVQSDMPRPKRSKDGVITYHIPFSIGLLASEMAESKCLPPEAGPSAPVKKRKSSGCITQNKRDDAAGAQGYRLRRGNLSYTPTRRLQVKMDDEIEGVNELIRPLLDTQKELVSFLSMQDEAKIMKREMMRKCLYEDVWGSLQKRLHHHMAVCNPVEIKMRQNLYQLYLNHGNTKGYVFLDMCDLNQYNPYLLHGKKPHKCKLRTAELKAKEVLFERSKIVNARCEAGCQYKWIRQSKAQDGDDATPAISLLPVESAKCSTSCERTCLDIMYHIRESSILDGTCHHAGCSFSR